MDGLRCENLSKAFGGVKALADFSVDFPASGVVAIIGPNGAGKTTLLNVLTGFVRPDSGRCFAGDREITKLRSHDIVRLGVSRTFQDPRLVFRLSVLENALLACPSQKGETFLGALLGYQTRVEVVRNLEEISSLLSFAGLGGVTDKFAAELSYGHQKLLGLVCCLATKARILLLDEPVTGVHLEMRAHILDLLSQMGTERLVVLVEHDIAAVRQSANIVIVMDHGRVIAKGRPHEVLERPEILEAYIA